MPSTVDAGQKLTQPVSRLFWAAPVLLLLGACGSNEPSVDAAGQTGSATTGAKADQPDARLVSAVPLNSNGTPAVGVRFEVLDRPLPNAEFRVRLVWKVRQATRVLQSDYVPVEGLQLASGNAQIRANNLDADATVERVLSLRATQIGRFLVQVSVRTDGQGSNDTTQFALPVLVEPAPASKT